MKEHGELLIAAGNPLLEARKEYTMIQQKLLYIAISQINYPLFSKEREFDINFYDVILSKRDVIHLLGNKDKSLYRELEKICDDLFSKVITIEDKNADTYVTKVNVFSRFTIDKKQGCLKINFNPYMKPYLLELKQRFAISPLSHILCLNGTRAIRLYEIILAHKWKNDGHFGISIEQLKHYLVLEDSKSYDRMDNFRRKCLDKPIKEINSKLAGYCEISYETDKERAIREGKKASRSVKTIYFTVKDKTNTAPVEKEVTPLAIVERRVYYKRYAAMMVELTANAPESDQFNQNNAWNMLVKYDPGLEALPYYIEAAKEYADNQKETNTDFHLTAGILTQAVKNTWLPNNQYYRDQASIQVNKLIQAGVIAPTF